MECFNVGLLNVLLIDLLMKNKIMCDDDDLKDFEVWVM